MNEPTIDLHLTLTLSEALVVARTWATNPGADLGPPNCPLQVLANVRRRIANQLITEAIPQ